VESNSFFKKLIPEKIMRERYRGGGGGGSHGIIVDYKPSEEEKLWVDQNIESQVNATISSIKSNSYIDDESVYFVLGLNSVHFERKRTPEPRIKIFDDNFDIIMDHLQGNVVAYLNHNHNKILVSCPMENLINFDESLKYRFKYFTNKVYRISPLLKHEKISSSIRGDEESYIENDFKIIYIIPNLINDKKIQYINEVQKYLKEKGIICVLFINEGIILANINLKLIEDLIDKFNYVFKIEPIPIGEKNQIQTLENTELRKITAITNMDDLPHICVMDSGVSDIPALKDIIDIRDGLPVFPEYYDGCNPRGHGTSVSYLVSFGEKSDTPYCKVISYKIYSDVRRGYVFRGFQRGLYKYREKTRIFTSSINFKGDYPAVTRTLDKIVQSLNVCFINSTGNISTDEMIECKNNGLPYPEYLDYFPVWGPSQAISITAVGAITKKRTKNSLADVGQISPFSRNGTQNNYLYDSPKPEVAQNGGNFCSDGTYSCGLSAYTKEGNEFQNFCGTSFSAPLFARRIALIEKIYGNQIDNAETLKALAYASTQRILKEKIGFGESQYFTRPSNYQSIFFAEGSMMVPNKSRPNYELSETHKIKIKIPKGIKSIEVLIVHSDDLYRNTEPKLNTNMIVRATKTANETGFTEPKNKEEFSRKSHVKCYRWQFKRRSMEGEWSFHITPEVTTEILDKHKKETTVRYGCAIIVTAKTPSLTSMAILEMMVNN